MTPDPFLGVLLHAVGGLAAASFYIPFKKVRGWNWETFWLAQGIISWLLTPWIVSRLTVPGTMDILRQSSFEALRNSYLFGFLWGIGGLTFGLSMRYLGMSLGYALALGSCAFFGALIPPIYDGTFSDKFSSAGGPMALGGVVICLVGIAICGMAGISKEREMPDAQKREAIKEFSFKKGVWVALFCGVLSACMAFGLAAGKSINDNAVAMGADPLWKGGPLLIVILAGGLTSNFIWCIYLLFKNRTGHEYASARDGGSLTLNYMLCAVAGVTWYLQFMFYTMGSATLGDGLEFSSWTLHMAFIIVFSNIWGLIFKEWRGASSRSRGLIFSGIMVLIVSTIVIGYGNYLDAQAKETPETAVASNS